MKVLAISLSRIHSKRPRRVCVRVRGLAMVGLVGRSSVWGQRRNSPPRRCAMPPPCARTCRSNPTAAPGPGTSCWARVQDVQVAILAPAGGKRPTGLAWIVFSSSFQGRKGFPRPSGRQGAKTHSAHSFPKYIHQGMVS